MGKIISRLSPQNIKDPLIRSRLYKAIREPLPEWDRWEVSIDEIDKPELISFRYYGTDAAKIIVCVATGLDDMRGNIRAGIELALPPLIWVRLKIKELKDTEERIRMLYG